ncbi:MAG: aminotransferase class I/II-fold pyridoxal phosphate-dependent enzyme [Rhizomicrobium sp.]
MLFPGRLSELPPSAFAKLATLLDPHKPGRPPISLAVGDPNGAVPDFVAEAIARHAAEFGTYPPINGSAEWRAAAAGWLTRRFALAEGSIDPDKNLLPLNGTREGLFLAAFTVMPETKAGQRPAVLLPNPFYQCYAAAALSAGGEPVFVPATAATGFLPDYASLPKALLERTAVVYLCSPSNPEGACSDESYWRTLFALADQYDFTVFADECYADIYLDKPPVGALPGAGARLTSALLTFHSLSKRSGPARAALGYRGGRGRADRALPPVPQLCRPASAAADHRGERRRRGATRRTSRRTARAIARNSAWRSGYWATAPFSGCRRAGSSCGSMSAMARRPRSSYGARPASAPCPAPSWVEK